MKTRPRFREYGKCEWALHRRDGHFPLVLVCGWVDGDADVRVWDEARGAFESGLMQRVSGASLVDAVRPDDQRLVAALASMGRAP